MGRSTHQNHLYTPALWAGVCEDNKDLTNDFLEYLRSTDHSDSTVEQYKHDLQIFFCYVEQNMKNKPFVEITKRELIRWQNVAINEWEWSPARTRRFKATISSLSNYIENILDDEYPDFRSIINKIPNPANEPVREKTILTDKQIQDLIDELVRRKEYEELTALTLALYSGRRKSELPRFKMSYFTDDCVCVNNSFYKTPEKVKTKGRGKTGKLLNLFVLKQQFDPYLNVWKDYREKNGIESEWLLYNPQNPSEPLPVHQLNSWADEFSKILGVPFYWHCVRHHWCSALAASGVPIDQIQKIAGWSDLSMVSIYDDRDIDDELEKYFVNGKIVQHDADLSQVK